MTLIDAYKVIRVSNVVEFVKVFNAEDEIKELYGKSIDDWDFTEEADGEVIGEILDRREGTFFLVFIEENIGYFDIYFLVEK